MRRITVWILLAISVGVLWNLHQPQPPEIQVRERAVKFRLLEGEEVGIVERDDAEWREQLTPEEYHILREKGTESPYSGDYMDNKQEGIYLCRACGLPVFGSDAKYDSHTGWPSYWKPYEDSHIVYVEDRALFMVRIEIQCARCSSHLGHVFDDGPPPTGKRYCINSLALEFKS